ncbi:MAG: ABC transporter substrate-binding protein [Ruminococcus sp.]|nr:ABC transporter substrate-binding protein [Ruminococcus sp.]
MRKKLSDRAAALSAAFILLCGCAQSEQTAENAVSDGVSAGGTGSDALSWVTWGGYDSFWELLGETYPDIEIDYIGYDGANYTGYSWAQMRGDDIPDLFSTSQILDRELAKERLLDLSGYDFMNNISTSVLDQVSIDGGVYLLPVSNAMYGILYNKTLMEEMGWELPQNYRELDALCGEIKDKGMIPGVVGSQLTGNAFSAVLNLAKTGSLTTPEGSKWERDFLAGDASAEGVWEESMDYVQKYIDIGMYCADPDDRSNSELIEDYMAGRKAVFFTMSALVESPYMSSGDEWGMMPYVGEDGSKNIYMYNPTSYIGISSRLAEPGNEAKLEKALRLLSLLYSDEGQSVFIREDNPCVTSVLKTAEIPEDSMIYDAVNAMSAGKAFHMTYAGWENVLADMGQAYKEWFRGENGMDGKACIARMDQLQTTYIENRAASYFCESTGDFTLEETARLIGMALGEISGADAALIPYGTQYKDGVKLKNGVSGKLYTGGINSEISNTICPGNDGEYAVMTMTGAQIKALAEHGLDLTEELNYPYALVTKGGAELEDDASYSAAFPMYGYTEETAGEYGAVMEKLSLRTSLREWLGEKKTVSPNEDLWD